MTVSYCRKCGWLEQDVAHLILSDMDTTVITMSRDGTYIRRHRFVGDGAAQYAQYVRQET